jgi:hypothetical protein
VRVERLQTSVLIERLCSSSRNRTDYAVRLERFGLIRLLPYGTQAIIYRLRVPAETRQRISGVIVDFRLNGFDLKGALVFIAG